MPNKTYVFNENTLQNALDAWIAQMAQQEETSRSQEQDALLYLLEGMKWKRL